MATEYVLYGSAEASTEDIRLFMAQALGGAGAGDGAVHRDGLSVSCYAVAAGEQASATELFGFPHRVTATFRFSNSSPASAREHNKALMVKAILSFFERYPGQGVLLFNGEEVTLQKLDGDVEFNSAWEEWVELSEVVPMLAGHRHRPLAQPLL